jgi:hypothetical protein
MENYTPFHRVLEIQTEKLFPETSVKLCSWFRFGFYMIVFHLGWGKGEMRSVKIVYQCVKL